MTLGERLYQLRKQKYISQDELADIMNVSRQSISKWHYEYKSKKTYKGIPLVHVNLGLGIYCAKGIIAVGNIAKGVIAVGGLSLGIASVGGLCIGLLALGGIAMGLILALGGVALSTLVSIGGVAVGTFAIGGIALGFYRAIGGIAISKYPMGALKIYLGNKNSYLPILKMF